MYLRLAPNVYANTIQMYPKPLLFVLFFLIQSCIFYILPSISISPNNYTDQQSLIAFKSAIEFDPNGILAKNWTLDTNFCHWHGVSCSKRRQRVTALQLRNMSLVGPISPHIGNLSFLTVLDLRYNNFHGQVIKELSQLKRLTILYLGSNKLSGEIPLSLPLCQNLKAIDITDNGLTGTLPKNLSTLPRLQYIYLGTNSLSGTIPASFWNITTLEILSLEFNQLHGDAFKEMGLQYSMLSEIYVDANYLTGTIPPSLFNMSSLGLLAISGNQFTGVLPNDPGLQLPSLTKLFLDHNNLTGTVPSNLYNASRLTHLSINKNYFIGTLPPLSLLNSLQTFDASNCQFQGEIPKGIASLKNLTLLHLGENKLRGNIPMTIKGMERLQRLYLYDNELDGHIPKEICLLKNLGGLFLDGNQLSGSIPDCIGNLTGLQELYLGSNAMTSTIPLSLWDLNLFILDLSSNFLDGSIDKNNKVSICLETLNLSGNQLSGNIPTSLGSFQSLTYLDLSRNSFRGQIPESFGKLITLVDLNISNNNLSGSIPKSLEAISYLKNMNLSYNKLSGEIPTGGPFVNFTTLSFIGNQNLCGQIIQKACPSNLKKSSSKQFPIIYIVLIIVVMAIVGVFSYVFCKQSRRNSLHQPPENSLENHRMISYHELSYATNRFSEANILGSGGFGCVYKGILSNGETVAVKLLNLTIDGAIKSFDAECKVLRTIRHRNLVKVISVCINPELRALVLEYIPNGSLEKWLYSYNYFLSFLERVSIMLNVSVAIDYLHCGQPEPVIHCDLKPSNVLLDEDMVAHVADFGIAKILAANQNETQTNTLGTFGYIAPEYGAEGRVSTKGDTYSYGIMLLETFTRKKPTDKMFSEGLSLRQWVQSLISNGFWDIVDENLLNAEAQNRSAISLQSNLLAILELGLGCSRDSPEERFEMKDVVLKLNKIKLQILTE